MSNPKFRLNVNLDLSLDSESGLASIQEAFDKKKAEIENGVKEAVQELGEMSRELMVTNILNSQKKEPGALADSIMVQYEDEYSFSVGSTLGGIVPTVFEEGRGPVYATNARCLHYVDDGKEYFVKSVSGYEGSSYVSLTAEAISNIAKDVILNKIHSNG